MHPLRSSVGALASVLVIVCAAVLLALIDGRAKAARRLPTGIRPVIRVADQVDGYRVYRAAGLRGVHVVHFGQHFYLMPYFLYERSSPVPFPIETHDVRPLYEEGLDSHSWLFVANRTGLVRRVTAVLPDSGFRERIPALDAEVSFRKCLGGYLGYSYDMPREVYPVGGFSCPDGPVVVNVDAGIFADGLTPEMLDGYLRRRCADIRMVLLVDSKDDPSVTDGMRRNLDAFERLFRQGKR